MRRILLVALALAGCGHHAAPAPPDMAFQPAFAAHDKVDILFVIANFAMIPKRQELLNRFPQLTRALAAASPASYHIGIITTDLGSGSFVFGGGQCHPDGDGAKLQLGPYPNPLPSAPSCSGFSLANGARYIDWDLVAGTNNLVGISDVPAAFRCLSSFSDGGCPFFQPLEAAYRAVANPPAENAGFLRDDALLVIVFLQDTDDCSAPIDSPVFDRTGDSSFTPMHCARNNIACGNPRGIVSGTSGGPFDDCVPIAQADGGQLYDAQRYIDFFKGPGGAKPDPSDVILGSIAPPPSPFEWSTTSCFNAVMCANLGEACVPFISGGSAPAVRLDAVVPSLGSMCTQDYSAAIDNLAQQIIARLR
jgi:hypothetical protein